ncbi:hypothetical protein ACHQM5_006407 [Ranunculus cassubicifolius]
MIKFDQLDELLNTNSIIFSGARWKVMFTDEFMKSLRSTRNFDTRKDLVSLLMRLSSGWRHSSQKQTNLNLNDGTSSQILELYKVTDLLNLIWTVDVDVEGSKFIQVMKFWDILRLSEVPKLIARLDTVFGSYTVDKMNRCKFKLIEGKLEVPMSWEMSRKDAVQLGSGRNNEHDILSNQLASLRLNDGRHHSTKASRSCCLRWQQFFIFFLFNFLLFLNVLNL